MRGGKYQNTLHCNGTQAKQLEKLIMMLANVLMRPTIDPVRPLANLEPRAYSQGIACLLRKPGGEERNLDVDTASTRKPYWRHGETETAMYPYQFLNRTHNMCFSLSWHSRAI